VRHGLRQRLPRGSRRRRPDGPEHGRHGPFRVPRGSAEALRRAHWRRGVAEPHLGPGTLDDAADAACAEVPAKARPCRARCGRRAWRRAKGSPWYERRSAARARHRPSWSGFTGPLQGLTRSTWHPRCRTASSPDGRGRRDLRLQWPISPSPSATRARERWGCIASRR